MIDRQSCYNALFKLRNAGVDITEQLNIMKSSPGIPYKVVEFLRTNSPQFQFYEDIRKNQRALLRNILNYESLDRNSKIKLCSSLITRAFISVEYKHIDESLLSELELDRLSKALDSALSYRDYSKLDEVLESHKKSMLLFIKS
jgi:hypothetical protein